MRRYVPRVEAVRVCGLICRANEILKAAWVFPPFAARARGRLRRSSCTLLLSPGSERFGIDHQTLSSDEHEELVAWPE